MADEQSMRPKTMTKNNIKTYISMSAIFVLAFGVMTAVTPKQAHAFSLGQIIDPGCFFACDNGGGGHTTKNVTNYYNGNYHSPGGTVINGNVSGYVPSSGGSYGYGSSPTVVNSSPTYSYNYNYPAPYAYSSSYSYYSQPSYVQPVVYQQPTYVQPTYVPTYSPLYVSCSPSSTYANVGSPVTWTAYASGGTGYYTYTWSGTDGMYGSGQSMYYNYNNPGYKTASVTVYSNGQSITQTCSNSVQVNGYYGQAVVAQPVPVYQPNLVSTNYNGLDIGCYADPINASPNQPVTWNVEVTGGVGPYSYSWTGTDGLTGSAASVIKYYSTSGAKSAVVTVTTADGRSSVHACSNSITVRSNAPAAPKPVTPAPVQTQQGNGNSLSAASLFALTAIPWGWIAVLVILVLFAAVIYLIYSKPKA